PQDTLPGAALRQPARVGGQAPALRDEPGPPPADLDRQAAAALPHRITLAGTDENCSPTAGAPGDPWSRVPARDARRLRGETSICWRSGGSRMLDCGKTDVPLEIEHLTPRARGGSHRVSNLALACEPRNQKQGTRDAADMGHPEVQAQAKPSLKEAAAVNAT